MKIEQHTPPYSIEKTLRNICGHVSWYRIKTAGNGIDIESDVNGLCDVCVREDAQFKAQIAETFSRLFDK